MARTYTGRDTGRILEGLLKRARRRLWVSTPYLSPEYAALLERKHREGVDVRLVTSDSPVNRRALARLAVTQPRGFWETLASWILYLLAVLLAGKRARRRLQALASSDVKVVGWRVPLRIYPVSRLVHSKIYIVDGVAVTGSVNLTKTGLWRNTETITIHEDPQEVREIEEQFMALWTGA